jgi:hypothetical protein
MCFFILANISLMASGVVVYWWKVEGGSEFVDRLSFLVEGGRWIGVRLSLIGNRELGTDNWKLITHNCEL